MIVYNTTFHVAKGYDADFLRFARTVFIPQAIADGTLRNPRLSMVLARAEGDDGTSYSVQFDAQDVDSLQKWYSVVGRVIFENNSHILGKHTTGFSTLMQVLPIE
ncbi:MAG: DUF4286 family protein [Muribaculaceae bacterium]|nr:DUF4286 family protein [Muribaculaceae bacterium]